MGQGDIIRELAWLAYTQNEPKSIFRNTHMMWIQIHGITFGGERKYSELIYQADTRFMNYWGTGLSIAVQAPRLEINELRGDQHCIIPLRTTDIFLSVLIIVRS